MSQDKSKRNTNQFKKFPTLTHNFYTGHMQGNLHIHLTSNNYLFSSVSFVHIVYVRTMWRRLYSEASSYPGIFDLFSRWFFFFCRIETVKQLQSVVMLFQFVKRSKHSNYYMMSAKHEADSSNEHQRNLKTTQDVAMSWNLSHTRLNQHWSRAAQMKTCSNNKDELLKQEQSFWSWARGL